MLNAHQIILDLVISLFCLKLSEKGSFLIPIALLGDIRNE